MKNSLLLIIFIFISACATHESGNTVSYWDRSPDTIEQPPGRATHNTGDMIITSWLMSSAEAVYIPHSFLADSDRSKKMFGAIDVTNSNIIVELQAGPALLVGQDGSGARYYKSHEQIRLKSTDGAVRNRSGGIRIPPEHKAEGPSIYWDFKHRNAFYIEPESKIEYSSLPPITTLNAFTGLGKTITYLGLSGGQIKFVYKEFNDDIIRSAFTQEFSFDYKPDQEYTYKNASFIVHTATASKIDLTTLKHFSD